MSTRLKMFFLISGLTVVCASCASTCGEDEEKPHVVNVAGKPGTSVMTKPRVLQARELMDAAGAVPAAP